MRRDLVLETVERDVEPVVDRVPSTELDLAELRMLELVPVDIRTRIVLLRPLEQRDVVLDRMVPDPVGEVVVGETGLPLWAPELRRPREDAEVVVQPVVRASLDGLLRLVLEVVADRDGRITRQLASPLSDQRARAKVGPSGLIVRATRGRAPMHTAERAVR